MNYPLDSMFRVYVGQNGKKLADQRVREQKGQLTAVQGRFDDLRLSLMGQQ